MEHTISLSDLMVVLVEPSVTQHKIIKGFFAELGVNDVTCLESGRAALESVHRVKPDLLISAMYLPDMTGKDLVEAIRNDADLSELGFILVSSETHFRYLNPVRQAGAIAILPKPFELSDLKRVMNATLDYIDPVQLEDLDIDMNSIKVLLVDDSVMSRNYIRRVLVNMGIEDIVQADDGESAVLQLNDHQFDLVVTDYNMPGMDGLDLVEYIRSQSEQSSVPILMITSEQDGHRLSVVQQAGVSALCDKPFDVGNIRKLVVKLLQAEG